MTDWNAPLANSQAIEAALIADFDALVTQVASETTLPPHVAPPPALAGDEGTVAGRAVYTAEGTRYSFPCAEVYAGRGSIEDGNHATEAACDVYVSFSGTPDELSAWAPIYLTALVRLFMSDPDAGLWWPASYDTSPIGHDTAEGTYVRSVLCSVRFRTT